MENYYLIGFYRLLYMFPNGVLRSNFVKKVRTFYINIFQIKEKWCKVYNCVKKCYLRGFYNEQEI